jgi:hypothetical protein
MSRNAILSVVFILAFLASPWLGYFIGWYLSWGHS